MIGNYPSPAGGEEYAVTFDRGRAHRLLIVPALFDEANKLRHFTIEVMRRLDTGGVDTFLPDLPGCNESLVPLEQQSFASWRAAVMSARDEFHATHQLGIRGGSLIAVDLPGWAYAPVAGASLLSGLMRARIIASREAGISETREALLEAGVDEGLELAGSRLGPVMVADLHSSKPLEELAAISQGEIGGGALWLRAEPNYDPAQAESLAGRLIGELP